MQEAHFETIVKDGYIKVPEQYAERYNKKVVVDIVNKDIAAGKKYKRGKKTEEFLRKCSGILDNSPISADITKKEIREMRLNEKYGI
ncbi:MAG: hypothetical protein KAW12_20820 [Candidatus Aminicenantes bacterium]|nr:hypothetical protein [Candidatus Aminicenantes bacterium]